ncbi:MAG: DNA alkylation repair protein [Candidatus Thorarchaeota archaeon]
MSEKQAKELIESLRGQKNEEQAKIISGYLKTSDLEFFGVKLPQIHKATKEHIRGVTKEELPAYANNLWREEIFEVRCAAIDVMKKYVKKGDVSIALEMMSSWIDDIDTWALMDPLCSPCLGIILLRDNAVEKIFKSWQTSPNFWRRRASVLPYLHLAKKTVYRPEYSPKIIKMIRPHISDREFFVGKAAAWVLRELGKRDPSTVKEFIETNREKMTPLVIREGGRLLK